MTVVTAMETLGIKAFAYCRCLKNLVVPSTLQNVTGGIIACEIPSAQIRAYYESLLESTSAIRESAFDTNRTLDNAAVPEDITAIGTGAFQYIYCLKKAILPIGLLTIGTYAFRNDFQLGTVAFPVTLTAIDQNAFEQCFGVEEVVLPGSLRSVNNSAFLNCYGLRELEIRGNSMVLNSSAFSGCYGLKELHFSPGVTAISLSGSVFTNTGLEVLRNLPQKVTFTGGSTFNACGAVMVRRRLPIQRCETHMCCENVDCRKFVIRYTPISQAILDAYHHMDISELTKLAEKGNSHAERFLEMKQQHPAFTQLDYYWLDELIDHITLGKHTYSQTELERMTPMERKRNDDRTLTIHWRCGIKTKVSSGVIRDSAHPKHIAQLWDAFVLRYPDRYPEITQQVLELEARERGEVG